MKAKRIVSNGRVNGTHVLDEEGKSISLISGIHINDIVWGETLVRANVEFSMVELDINCCIEISPCYLEKLRGALNQFGYDIVKMDEKTG